MNAIGELQQIAWKIQGIASLMKNHSSESVEADTSLYGVGVILNECSSEIMEILRSVEKNILESNKEQKSSDQN